MRHGVVSAAVGILIAGTLASGASAADPQVPATPDHLRAFSIDPPGEDGTVTAAELATGRYGRHFSDQLGRYAALIDDGQVTARDLHRYFHRMRFGPGRVARVEAPRAGVTIYRDRLGIPHVYARSRAGATYGLGYVTAEDRLFEMDLFRHAAEGTLAQFIGPGSNDQFLKMDIATRREGYTATEVRRMYQRLDDRFGRIGRRVQRGLQGYTDGVNEYINRLKTDPAFADKQPVEYDLTENPIPAFPDPWTNVDTLQIAILQLRVFGLTAGDELQNADFYAHLVKRLGKQRGRATYNDLVFQNDPRSPTSISAGDGNFHTQRLGKLDWGSVAIPDHPASVARRADALNALRTRILARMGFAPIESNAFLVGAKKSVSGHPLQIGAPQVGYAVPSFFMQIDVHAPGIDVRGPAVPGASALVPLGRGSDYAWTLTTGMSDAVDTRAERLCDPGGGTPTIRSTGYVYKGRCRAMKSRSETFVAKPTPAAPGAPRVVTKTFYRTVHGPLIARGTVRGRPVAFTHQMMFWKREIDSIPAFFRWNTAAHTVRAFARAARRFSMSFNAFYVNARHIAYYHVGYYPVRARHVSPSLPVWGTGAWEWRGRRAFSKQPHIVDPKTGWLVNWNNKPARGWNSLDTAKWGVIQRVRLIKDDMHSLLDRRKATLARLVDVMRDVATRDVRGVYLGPRMVRWASRARLTSVQRHALRAVGSWLRAGARRLNRDRNSKEDRSPALVTFDRWYRVLVHRVFDDELGKKGYRHFTAPISDYDPAQGSSFFFDFSNYLDNLFGRKSRGLYSRNYCDLRGTRRAESCRGDVVVSFRRAVRHLARERGADVARWRKPAEWIEFSALGAGTVRHIPWQNRGTHNHVVEVLSSGR